MHMFRTLLCQFTKGNTLSIKTTKIRKAILSCFVMHDLVFGFVSKGDQFFGLGVVVSIVELFVIIVVLIVQRLEPEKKKIVYGGRRRKRFGMPEDYGWEGE